MGFTEVLTIVFVVMKLIGVISWPWVVVFLPEIIAVGAYASILLVMLVGPRVATFGMRLQKRLWDEWDDANG